MKMNKYTFINIIVHNWFFLNIILFNQIFTPSPLFYKEVGDKTPTNAGLNFALFIQSVFFL